MANNPIIFGQSNSINFRPTSVRGMDGWFTVPPGFYMKPNPNNTSEMICSPNADFSNPVYYCVLSDDMMTYAFQDMLLAKYFKTR